MNITSTKQQQQVLGLSKSSLSDHRNLHSHLLHLQLVRNTAFFFSQQRPEPTSTTLRLANELLIVLEELSSSPSLPVRQKSTIFVLLHGVASTNMLGHRSCIIVGYILTAPDRQ